jgi:hypothetical protein
MVEWSIEGDELKKYYQIITTNNCHTNNPTTVEGSVNVDVIKKVR